MPSHLTTVFQPIITDLVNNRIASPDDLERALRAKNWTPAPFNRVVVIAMDDTPALRFRNNYIMRSLQAASAGRKIARIGDELLALEEYDEQHKSLSGRDIAVLIKRYKLPAGVSNEFSQLFDLRKHYEQARKAIRYNGNNGSNVSYYREFMLQDFLGEIKSGIVYRDYCHPGVLFLQEYDTEHHSDLCRTLFLYISCNRSPTMAGERMGIHKNTVSNRLNRIADMIDFNAEDEDEAFHALLTLRLIGEQG
jgi:sugar diacid utilization regulator